jgi:hypothetical protein
MTEFNDIVKLVDAVKKQPYVVVQKDDIEADPPVLGFQASNDKYYCINIENFQKSVKEHAPNNRKVALFTNAMKSEKGRDNFLKFVNEGKENEKEEEEVEDVEEEVEEQGATPVGIDQNTAKKYFINSSEEPEGQIIDTDSNVEIRDKMRQILDECGRDLLTVMSTASDDIVDEWLENYPYGMLLLDVIKGDGPKGLWLKVVLDRLEECGGKLQK